MASGLGQLRFCHLSAIRVRLVAICAGADAARLAARPQTLELQLRIAG
jgi:hypothetical protein